MTREAMPDLTSYQGVQQVTEIDLGQSLHTLMRLSHIHLFGIGILALTIGCLAHLSQRGIVTWCEIFKIRIRRNQCRLTNVISSAHCFDYGTRRYVYTGTNDYAT
jgi:hypothetical protein